MHTVTLGSEGEGTGGGELRVGGHLVGCESVTQVGHAGVLAWAVSASLVMRWVRRLRRVCGLSRCLAGLLYWWFCFFAEFGGGSGGVGTSGEAGAVHSSAR